MSSYATTLSKLILKFKFPGYDTMHSTLKVPFNPKIVVFGTQNHLFDHLLNSYFKELNRVNLEELAAKTTSEDDLVTFVSKDFSNLDGPLPTGWLIHDFPRTPDQALELDKHINGVNLAVNITVKDSDKNNLAGKYIECTTCGKLYNMHLDSTHPQLPGTSDKCNTPSSCNLVDSTTDHNEIANQYQEKYAKVLEYYYKTGVLLNFEVDPSWTTEEALEKFGDAYEAYVKL